MYLDWEESERFGDDRLHEVFWEHFSQVQNQIVHVIELASYIIAAGDDGTIPPIWEAVGDFRFLTSLEPVE